MPHSINVRHIFPVAELRSFIRKISVFECLQTVDYIQKLTPNPYNYLSYNHKAIPISKFRNRVFKPKERLMFTGVKLGEFFVEYKGPLLQILVEFTASGFYNLFRQSPVPFVDHLIRMNKIDQQNEVEALQNCLQNLRKVEDQVEKIEEYLSSKISGVLPPVEYVESAIEILEKKKGVLLIKDLADEVNVSERQLNRKFNQITGIPPKKFSKILQLHFLISLISEGKTIQDLTFEVNFFDRPHLNNSFKKLTGMTPVQFIRSDNYLAFQYYKNL